MRYNQKVLSTFLYKLLKKEIMEVLKKEWEEIPLSLRIKLEEIVNDIILHLIKCDIDLKRCEEIEDYEHCQMTIDLIESYVNMKIEEIVILQPGINKKKVKEQMKECQKFIRNNC